MQVADLLEKRLELLFVHQVVRTGPRSGRKPRRAVTWGGTSTEWARPPQWLDHSTFSSIVLGRF
jgi:hypothetical protein